MSKRAAEDPPLSSESRRVGPDVLGVYRSQIAELLSQEENTPDQDLGDTKTPSGDIVGAKMSKLRRDKLNALLRKCVKGLNPEIDAMLKRLQTMHLMYHLGDKASSTKAQDIINKDPTYKRVQDEIQLVQAADQELVKELVTQHSNDILTRLDKMKQELEELLDNVVATCSNRPMTPSEKEDLQKSIKELPQQNLERVAEIIKNHNTVLGNEVSDEVLANIQKEDNTVLWRVRFFIGAVKNARKLATYESKK